MRKLKITLKRSRYGWKPEHREALKGLGLKKIGQTVVRDDTPEIRGMVRKISHLVEVEEYEG
jgi:large subunit ribosomal protein L30